MRVTSRPIKPRQILIWAIVLAMPALTLAGTRIENDPQGFNGIRWGTPLSQVEELKLAESSEYMQGYDLAEGKPTLGQVSVDYMRFFAVDDQSGAFLFARVTIRYQGEASHKQVLAYLEDRFGSVEHSPDSMMRGLNQLFNWRGSHTEINLTYDGFREQGYLFIESRKLAPLFNQGYSDRAI